MPYKYIAYPASYAPPFATTVEGEQVTFEARAPVKGLVLDVAQEKNGEHEVSWSDQCLVSPAIRSHCATARVSLLMLLVMSRRI